MSAPSTDGTVRLWDVATQKQIGAALRGIPNRWVAAAVARDGSRRFADYDSGRAYRWDVRPSS